VLLVAPQAERADVRQIAFAAAFRNRKDVIRIPETPAPRMKIQLAAQCPSFACGDQLKSPIEFKRIQTASRANAAISRQHLVAQIAGIRSQTPFVDARIAAKCATSFRHFQPAPSAYASAIGPALFGAKNPPAGFFSQSAHPSLLSQFWGRVYPSAAGGRNQIESTESGFDRV